MTHSTITRFFKPEIDGAHCIKQEVDIDWDEADNCYGETKKSSGQENEYTTKVDLEQFSADSVPRKNSISKKASPAAARLKYSKKCLRCKQTFKHKRSLQSHNVYCGKDRHLQCAHCSYKTKYKMSLIVHLSKRHPEGKNSQPSANTDIEGKFSKICKKCKKSAESRYMTKCEKCFGKLLYQCSKCAKQFQFRTSAHYHWDTRCGLKGYFNYTKCDFKSVWRYKVIRHMIQTHQSTESSLEFENIQWIGLNHNMQERSESSLYQCLKCTKVMENSDTLARHIQICGGSNCEKNSGMTWKNWSEPNKCSNCGEEFEHIYSLNKHIRYCQKVPQVTRITEDDNIEVVELDEDLVLKSSIPIDKRHANIDRRESLKMSKQRFSQAMIHLKAHCSVCKKEQAIRDRLKNCRICKRSLCYKCKTCKKNYAGDDENVCDHVKGYLETIKFECRRCGRGAISEESLRVHQYICGVEARFRCTFCKYAAKLKGNLVRHEKLMHSTSVTRSRC